MKLSPGFDSLRFAPFSCFKDNLAMPEADIGRSEVLGALVAAPVFVVLDEGLDLLPKIAEQEVFLQQDATLE